jgi:ribonuclease J
VIENGTIVELETDKMKILERLPGGYVYVDGAGVGDVTRRVLRDRERLAEGGFFVAAVATNGTQVVGSPDFVSRGFLNLEKDVYEGVEEAIKKVVKSHGNKAKERLGQLIEEGISRYLYSESGKRPMVFVVLK